jgi:hypothetical protein
MRRLATNDDLTVRGDEHGTVTVSFGSEPAVAEKGVAIAAAKNGVATVMLGYGYAVALGYEGVAEAAVAVGLRDSGIHAIGAELAVALGSHGVALSPEVAVSSNLCSMSHADKIAIATGKGGLADGLLAIAVGEEGRAVARAGGTIAIAFYDRHPGRWESAHGCDDTWIDGDLFLAGLKIARVGEGVIQADRVYALDAQGEFVELGMAEPRKRFPERETEA